MKYEVTLRLSLTVDALSGADAVTVAENLLNMKLDNMTDLRIGMVSASIKGVPQPVPQRDSHMSKE